MERQGNDLDQRLVRGVNWAPDSYGESNDSSASEVRFVMDSLAGETEVPDSLEEEEEDTDVDKIDAADALMDMARTDVSKELHDKEVHEAASLLLSAFLPRMYGSKDNDVNDVALTLFWIGRGIVHDGGRARALRWRAKTARERRT